MLKNYERLVLEAYLTLPARKLLNHEIKVKWQQCLIRLKEGYNGG